MIVVPGAPRVTGGPYRWLPHPNYVAVVVEGFALPLVHSAWITALVFTVLNAALLRTRIRVENARCSRSLYVIDLLVAGGGPRGPGHRAVRARAAGLEVAVVERRTRRVDKACGEGLMPGRRRAPRPARRRRREGSRCGGSATSTAAAGSTRRSVPGAAAGCAAGPSCTPRCGGQPKRPG